MTDDDTIDKITHNSIFKTVLTVFVSAWSEKEFGWYKTLMDKIGFREL